MGARKRSIARVGQRINVLGRAVADILSLSWPTDVLERGRREAPAAQQARRPSAGAGVMNQPLVSCIIPCYNRPKYVRDAIDSALAQTYPDIEIVVVDDGSTDDTPKVLASYGDKITIIRQKNAGTA